MRPTVIACVSDLHAGGTTAMCPARITLDDGGIYEASRAQRWLFECWLNYWQRVAALCKTHKADLYEIFNGDLLEGFHHGTTQVVTGNPTAQAVVFNEAMRAPLALKPKGLFVVRGTPAHAGVESNVEERIADGLRRDRRPVKGDPKTGTASWWHLRAEFGGVRLDVAHHGRTGFREHTRGGAAVLHAHDIVLSHVKSGDLPPHLCLRGHHHKFNDSYDAAKVTRVVTTGAWQLATSYVHKVAADSLSDIGGVVVVIRDGKYEVEKVQFQPDRGAVWRPT